MRIANLLVHILALISSLSPVVSLQGASKCYFAGDLMIEFTATNIFSLSKPFSAPDNLERPPGMLQHEVPIPLVPYPDILLLVLHFLSVNTRGVRPAANYPIRPPSHTDFLSFLIHLTPTSSRKPPVVRQE